MNMFCAQKYNLKEYSRLSKVFLKNPTFLVPGSCIYTTNKTMDGISFILGIGNGNIKSGEVKWSDMKGLTDKKYLEQLNTELNKLNR